MDGCPGPLAVADGNDLIQWLDHARLIIDQ